MDRKIQLTALLQNLEQLINVLRLDPNCQWQAPFESFFQEANTLLTKGFSQDQLNSLSSSIMRVWGGAGSFSDYGPGIYNRQTGRYVPIPGTEGFEELAQRVYDNALALRVISE